MKSVKDTGRWNNKARATDMTGQRFGRLVCEERVMSDGSGGARWRCLCDCGKRAIVPRRSLTSGDTRSCGCLHAESARQRGRERAMGQAQANRLPGALNGSAKTALNGSAETARTLRIANAFADVFGKPVDTVHVDRSGARVIRGKRY